MYVKIFLWVRMRLTKEASYGLVFLPAHVDGVRRVKGYPVRAVNLTGYLFPANPNLDVQGLPSTNIATLWDETGLEAHSLVKISITAVGRGV